MRSKRCALPNPVFAFSFNNSRSLRRCVASGCCNARRKRRYAGRFDAIQSPLAMVAWSCMSVRRHHAPAGCGQVLRTKFRQAHELIAVRVAGIARNEKRDVRVLLASGWDLLQIGAKFLRMIEMNDAALRIELRAEPFARQSIEHSLGRRRRGDVEAREKFAPEYRQETISAK